MAIEQLWAGTLSDLAHDNGRIAGATGEFDARRAIPLQ
jgi:hypothetical protein